jgi:dGTPase
MSFEGIERTVCDYIAGMTDNYAVDKYTEIFIPMGWQTKG